MSGNAFILASALGVLGRRIGSDVQVIGEFDLDPVARLKLEAQRREALREEERRRERARTNFLPHGSSREAERRRRQIERGQLRAENGLAR